MAKQNQIRKFKQIKCKICGKLCRSGKKGLCNTHYAAEQAAKKLLKSKNIPKSPSKPKHATKKRKKGETITDKKIHQVFSWLVRAIYPEKCHACGVKLPSKNLQACHFVARGAKVITWYLKNVLPGCGTCNGFRQEHVYYLGLALNEYYGEGTADLMTKIGREIKSYKFDRLEKEKLFNLYTESLNKVVSLKQTLKGKALEEALSDLRQEIIKQTTYF